ncbi:MAG: glycosyltransferase [Spirochaetales bacterium]|jgi:uncharacterized protein|nr:glycosyltransferase [Spirochaetales bacterium]
MNKNGLIIFYKAAIPGEVKSRLAHDIGNIASAELYAGILRDLTNETREVDADILPYQCPTETPTAPIHHPWPNPQIQSGEDIGVRMERAFLDAFNTGYKRVVLCGSDIPGLLSEDLNLSFHILDKSKMVIGPTFDGGYYLIGFDREYFLKEVFAGIPWSTSTVFDVTTQIAGRHGYTPGYSRRIRDLDTLDDSRQIIRELEKNKAICFRKIWSKIQN